MYERFEVLLKEQGLSAYRLAQETGISTATLTSWKQGKYTPKPDKLQKIADFFGVQLKWLTGESEFRTEMEEMLHQLDSNSDLSALREEIKEARLGDVQIPVLGVVAAGVPIFASENYIDYEVISSEMAKNGDYFGLKIKGDSMSPRIMEGDTVIVRKQDDAESNDIVIAMINGDHATCKRLMKYEHGISLISFNPAYKPIEFTNQQILEKPVRIIGKVVENRQKY